MSKSKKKERKKRKKARFITRDGRPRLEKKTEKQTPAFGPLPQGRGVHWKPGRTLASCGQLATSLADGSLGEPAPSQGGEKDIEEGLEKLAVGVISLYD